MSASFARCARQSECRTVPAEARAPSGIAPRAQRSLRPSAVAAQVTAGRHGRRQAIAVLATITAFGWRRRAVAAEMPAGEFLEATGATVAVILAHGQGLDPDSQVVSPLRKAIHRELGWHTLSLQMPVLPGPPSRSQERFLAYAETFPEAFRRIQAGIDFLHDDLHVRRIYLMGYSMGGRMTTAFLASHPQPGLVVGYIGVGLVASGPEPLNSNLSLRRIHVPVLDVYAEDDMDARFAAARRTFMAGWMTQVPIAGARHDYRGYEDEIVRAVVAWLRRQERR